MNMPLVSIVTPCYNGEKYIERFFNSILSQEYKNLQLVFVNDGSADNTLKIAKSYKEKFMSSNIDYIILSQDNGGQASALNKGLKDVKGKYLLCMDSDDSLSENYIKEAVNLMENDNTVAYCYGNASCLDNEGEILKNIEKEIQSIQKICFTILFFIHKRYFSQVI